MSLLRNMGLILRTTMLSAPQSDYIIIGAGWAGLSAAISLTRAGKSVMLLEAAPKAGGRARSVPFGNSHIDNGQHLFLGAYKKVRQVLKWLNVEEVNTFQKASFYLTMQDEYHLHFAPLPFPFNAAIGLSLSNLAWSEKKSLFSFFYKLKNKHISLQEDCSVKEFLQLHKQSNALIKKLWEPIALAALTTPIDKASAKVFLSVIQKSFFESSQSSDYFFPKKDLSQLFVDPAIQYLIDHSQKIHFAERALEILQKDNRCLGVKTARGDYHAKSVIVATPPNSACSLLPDISELASLKNHLSQFTYQPITTVYLQFDKPVGLKKPMIGLLENTGQWWFDRKLTGQPNLLAIVISGHGAHDVLDAETLVQTLHTEVKEYLPHCNTLIDSQVIREKRAAFSCEVDIENIRPAVQTPLSGLWLAGDYTNTHLPATLEGAVDSGLRCASEILKQGSFEK